MEIISTLKGLTTQTAEEEQELPLKRKMILDFPHHYDRDGDAQSGESNNSNNEDKSDEKLKVREIQETEDEEEINVIEKIVDYREINGAEIGS
uniref:Uncharacterized protein n=1 Tax=Strongyloides papillosus TaxID=174720 RepID=A0A0N5BKW0_STREA